MALFWFVIARTSLFWLFLLRISPDPNFGGFYRSFSLAFLFLMPGSNFGSFYRSFRLVDLNFVLSFLRYAICFALVLSHIIDFNIIDRSPHNIIFLHFDDFLIKSHVTILNEWRNTIIIFTQLDKEVIFLRDLEVHTLM